MEPRDIDGRLEIDLPAALDLVAAVELHNTILGALSRDDGPDVVLSGDAVERVSTAAAQVILAAALAFKGVARRLDISGASPALTDSLDRLGLNPALRACH